MPPQRPQNLMWAGNAVPQRWHTRSACGGTDRICDEAMLAVLAIWGCVCRGMLSPQRPQNLEFAGRVEEHRGQGKVVPPSPGLTRTNEFPPQRPQNLTPSAK